MTHFGITQEDFDGLRTASTTISDFNSVDPESWGYRAASTAATAATNLLSSRIQDALPEGIENLSYAQAIEDSIVERVLSAEFREEDYDLDRFEADIQADVTAAFSAHIQSVPNAERFTALTDGLTELGAAVGDDTQTQLTSVVETINGLDPQLQTALTHAVSNNPEFVNYVIERMGSDAEGGLAGMLEDLDPRAVGPISDILTTIGNNPGYDTNLLDAVIDTTAEVNRLEAEILRLRQEQGHAANTAALDEQLNAATLAQLDAVQAAGGNIPALARLQTINGEQLQRFMGDLLMAGGGTEFAINNLAGALGIEGADLEAFQAAIAPFAGFIQFMIEPYAELVQQNNLSIDGMRNSFNDSSFGQLMNGLGRVEPISGPVTGEVTASFQAEATVDTIVTVDFGNDFTTAMLDGRSYEEVLDVVDAMEAANRDFSDEAYLLRDALENGIITEVELRETFGMSAAGIAPADAATVEAGVEAFLDRARATPSLQNAVVGGP